MSNSISCPRCGREFPRPAPGDYACPDCQNVVRVEAPAAIESPRNKRSNLGWLWIVGAWLFVWGGCTAQKFVDLKRDALVTDTEKAAFIITCWIIFFITAVPAFIALMVWWLRLPRSNPD